MRKAWVWPPCSWKERIRKIHRKAYSVCHNLSQALKTQWFRMVPSNVFSLWIWAFLPLRSVVSVVYGTASAAFRSFLFSISWVMCSDSLEHWHCVWVLVLNQSDFLRRLHGVCLLLSGCCRKCSVSPVTCHLHGTGITSTPSVCPLGANWLCQHTLTTRKLCDTVQNSFLSI